MSVQHAAAGRMHGKVALITGAAAGQGAVQARLFAEEGAAVVLADVAHGPGEACAAQLRAAGDLALYLPLDVRDADAWQAAVQRVRSDHGALHVLVNNAGIVSRDGVMDVPLDEWQRVLDVNLTGALLGMRACAPLMRQCGGGAIVNISSTAGLMGYAGAAYAASKWALRGLTKTAAMEFVDWGIRVNSVHPSQVGGTAIAGDAPASYREVTARVIPMGRPAHAEEVARAVLFLASDEASYMTGSELTIDGGYTAFGLPRLREQLIRQALQKTPGEAR